MSDPDLPSVDLFDQSIEGSGWQWRDGLCGLVPGVSSLAEAEKLFGPVCRVSELANGVTYDLLNGALRVTLLHGEVTLRKIALQNKPESHALLPQDIIEAAARFGKLAATKLDRFEGVVYERPGMRITCDPTLTPTKVLNIEIFATD